MKKMIAFMMSLLLLCGCSTVISDNTTNKEEVTEAYDLSFTESETDASYQINDSTYITLGNEDVKITNAGTYILEGSLENASIIVEVSENDAVQLVLNGVDIRSGDFAGIYIVEGDEITITLAPDTVNSISDSGTYTQIDSNDVDALIYSKADLIINGSGTLKLYSQYNHGIVSKDDLTITGGIYDIDVMGRGISGKDCLKISDGYFNIISGKDALKSDNEEDEYRGYVNITGGEFVITCGGDAIYGYSLVNIEDGKLDITTKTSSDTDSYKAIKSEKQITISGGEININAADDGIHSDRDILITSATINIVSDDDAIHADGMVQIDDGEISIDAHEGIEGTYVQINGGNISIIASDDGINAGQKISDYTATIEINGGYISIDMGQGDTDAVDSNGYIYVNGGTLDIKANSPFDYDAGAEYNGGTIIVNGTQTDSITNQMMGGGGMFGNQMPGQPGGFNNGYQQGPDGSEVPSDVQQPGDHHGHGGWH